MHLDGVHPVADYGALYAWLCRRLLTDRLAAVLGDCTAVWSSDGCIEFTSVEGTPAGAGPARALQVQAVRVAEVLIPDSAAGLDRSPTLTWGWAGAAAGRSRGPAAALCEVGTRFGIPALTRPHITVHDDAEVTLRSVAGVAAQAGLRGPCWAMPLLDSHADFAAGGYAIVELLGGEVPTPNLEDLARLLPDVPAPAYDLQVALTGLAAICGWHIAWSAGDSDARCDLDDGSSSLHIDIGRNGDALPAEQRGVAEAG